ncbi:MAG: hypothetical protein Q7J98_09575 [Kiritimatiellia bacterium]|nr:hypothetical protein [Kiritimatiellia bacterium]
MIQDNYAAGDKTRTQPLDCFKPNSSGMVLVVVVILAAVAGILSAGLHFTSGSRIIQVRQEMRFEKAFFVAEAGIERAKAELRTNGTNRVLSGGFTNYGEFYVNVRSNSSSTKLFIIRSTGIVETATRVIEVVVSNTPFDLGHADGAFGIYGTNNKVEVKGDSQIDGSDWNRPSTLGGNNAILSGNPTNPGMFCSSTNNTIIPQKESSIIGNPPQTNGVGEYNETDLLRLLANIMPTNTYKTGDLLGTRDVPRITLLPTDATTFNNSSGAGILIIPGDANLKITGNFCYEGMLIILGNGIVSLTDPDGLDFIGTARIFGAVICVGGDLNISSKGTLDVKYSTQALAALTNLPPVPARLDMISWREIKASSTN